MNSRRYNLFILVLLGVAIAMAVAFFVQRQTTIQTIPEISPRYKPWIMTPPSSFPQTEPAKPIKPKSKPFFPQKKRKKKLDLSGCEPNPNAPDYIAKRLNKDVDSNACGRIRMNFDF